jgi:Fe-S oxidoreductase
MNDDRLDNPCGLSGRLGCGHRDSRDLRYRLYRPDLGGDLFTLMRQDRGYSYSDALDTAADAGGLRSLFWPGCALSSYSKGLTEAVFTFLKERGAADGMSVRCCGTDIRYAGDRAAQEAYCAGLVRELQAWSVERVITVCPNCYRDLKEMQGPSPSSRPIEVLALSQFLVDEGLCVSPEQIAPTRSVCVHDSCPDRCCGVDAAAVRKLFEGIELHEMEHNRCRSRCCGLGRLQFIDDPANSGRRRAERIDEFRATGAEQLVTSCFSCANAFQNPATGLFARHYLELLFGIQIDWPTVYESSARIFAALGLASSSPERKP